MDKITDDIRHIDIKNVFFKSNLFDLFHKKGDL